MATQFAAAAAVLISCFIALATLASCNSEGILHMKLSFCMPRRQVWSFFWNMLLRLEGDILYKQRQVWKDTNNVLQSWDPTLVNPCTWFHVTWNNDNAVIRVYVTLSPLPILWRTFSIGQRIRYYAPLFKIWIISVFFLESISHLFPSRACSYGIWMTSICTFCSRNQNLLWFINSVSDGVNLSANNVYSEVQVPLLAFCRDLGNAGISGPLIPDLGGLQNLQYL